MTVENGEPITIRLAQNKQWLIPADSESYKVLAAVGIPLTIFHEDFLPTIKLVTDPHGIRGVGFSFRTEILEPFLEKVGTTWKKKADTCDCTIRSRDMEFEVSMKDPAFTKARASVDRMHDALLDFFDRWGYRMTFEYAEARSKAVVKVTYWHDPAKIPVIGLNEKPESDQEVAALTLGGMRITFKMDNFNERSRTLPARPGQDPKFEHEHGYVHVNVAVKQGGEFVPTLSTRARYAEVSNVLPAICQLMRVPQFNPNNFEVDA
ncbi:hypothetical protein BcepSauron_170 [Burkholderia phage BcepSauron]|uniref:Uncharacterized protein n=1 Tax=Burkholderia phage BcepSauron TaxID=2530033 RepID=A0A482MN82_9CAUD|nr:hypothetical protein H1O17_gp170 [Burkholderia phage BcepSauron]QBQ74550.1 hypothetical protein BcepSauron_170 [Burkholderia phage BcepSauron]